jgi:sugar phosphate isomerase/epimerase
MKHLIEIAGIFETKRFRMFSFYNAENLAGFREKAMENLGRLVDCVKGTGIILCHENEHAIYGESAENCLDIHKTFPEIKAVFDPANFVVCGHDPLSAWEILAPYTDYMHIKDATAEKMLVPAGCGIGKIKEILEDFSLKGGGTLTIEPHLTVFDGRNELDEKLLKDKERKMSSEYTYPSQRAAFDAAVAALRKVIA